MALTIFDSDVLIDAHRGVPSARDRVARALQSRSLATTSISVFELRSGARTPSLADRIEDLLAPTLVFDLDGEAAEKAAEIRRELEAVGTPIGMADYLIAGICMVRSATLLTRNRAHFARVAGLELEVLS